MDDMDDLIRRRFGHGDPRRSCAQRSCALSYAEDAADIVGGVVACSPHAEGARHPSRERAYIDSFYIDPVCERAREAAHGVLIGAIPGLGQSV